MKGRETTAVSWVFVALVVAVFVVTAGATAYAAAWQQLGQAYLDYRTNPVAIDVNSGDATVGKLKLQVKDHALEIREVKVFLAGGESFEVTLDAFVAAGRETRAFDVPGGPKAIKKVEVTYRNGSDENRLALVRLMGTS